MVSSAVFKFLVIVLLTVPKQFLTSELPSSDRLLTTTAIPTTQTTGYSTTEATTVQSTVTTSFNHKGDFSTVRASTSSNVTQATTEEDLFQGSSAKSTTATTVFHNYTTTSTKLASDVTTKDDDDVIIRNEFPMITDTKMTNDANVTRCLNCSDLNTAETSNFYHVMMNIYTFFKDNSDDVVIAILLALVGALLITICVLVFPCKSKTGKSEEESEKNETRKDNRQSTEEQHVVAETEAPVQEDEHENMSLLGSILQRSVSSNNTAHRQHASPNSSHVKSRSKVKQEQEAGSTCGPKSIFGMICCNCCCTNAPWQRTRLLKRQRGVYHIPPHRYSTSSDEDVTGRFRSQESFPVFSRSDDNVDNRAPIAVLEDHVNRTEYPIVTSATVTSAPVTSQSLQNSNFRPISRNAQRHYSVTPEPDVQYRTHQTFHPQIRHDSQRSDPALNMYNVRPQHNVAQPVTAPTSPVVNNAKHATMNGSHKLIKVYSPHPVPTPRLPIMGPAMIPNAHPPAHPPQSPMTPKYTPPPNHFYSTQQQFPTFTEAYEQYDNAQQRDIATRRKQFHRAQDYTPQSPHTHQHYNTQYGNITPGYHPQNAYGEHFVQAVARRTVPSNARTVDLAANARTVDLSHNNSLSRNSWLEIRRSSIYDNSLPRNNEMYDYYQQLQQQEMQQALHQHQDLPGSRNLNHYYP